jgi:hypothetical protein
VLDIIEDPEDDLDSQGMQTITGELKREQQKNLSIFTMHNYSLDLECPSKAQVLKTWSPAYGAIVR